MDSDDIVTTKNVVVRVRPQKVALIVSEEVDPGDFLIVVDFLSRIWGGKYCPIFVVQGSKNSLHVQNNLIAHRPDVVLTLGLDVQSWGKITVQCCQPRGFGALSQNYIKKTYEVNPHKLILAELLAKELMERFPEMERDNLYLFSREDSQTLSTFMTLSFGIVPDNEVENYSKALKAKPNKLDKDNISSYLNICSDMSRRWSWLDFASNHLSRNCLLGDFAIPPTIVVSADKISDFALFWNIRSQLGVGASGTIILFPESEIDSKESVEALSEWTIKSPINANYCVIRSSSVDKKKLDYLASRLRPRLKKSRYEYVDVKTEVNIAPVVVPYEKETHTKVYISKNRLSFDSIKPDFVDCLRSFDSWICDFVKESESNRALCELVLPPRNSAIQVLNTPTPPRFNLNTDEIRWGPDALNVKCSSNNPTVSFSVPTSEELITEILKESGINIIKDEKRVRYNQILRMLGGLKNAFLTFSGSSLKIIKAFLKDRPNSTNHIPLTLGEIKSNARLKKTGKENTNLIFKILDDYLPRHAKFVANQRFRKYYDQDISHGREEQAILDKLIQQGILKREWKLEKCIFCDKDYWVDHIDIDKPVKCPGCGNIITLKGQIVLGYELNELVRLGINEGIIPVILTANFLYNTTSKGFIWAPGIKFRYREQLCDFDLVCICDGHLLAAECKTLSETKSSSGTWSKISKQLEKTLSIAQHAEIEAFIMSSLNSSYSESFKKECKLMGKKKILNIFLLNNQDLTSGKRYIKRGKHNWPITVEDLLASEAKRRAKPKKSRGKRTITF